MKLQLQHFEIENLAECLETDTDASSENFDKARKEDT